MKRMKKIFVLFTMLIAGLSFKGTNATDKMVVAGAVNDVIVDDNKPAEGSCAYFSVDWKKMVKTALSNQGIDSNQFKTILITNKESELTKRDNLLTGCPVEVGVKGEGYTLPENYTNGCAVGAYLYPNATDTTMFDCILYANVETIYPNKGTYYDYSYYDYLSFFSKLSNVEKITFDCNFSMAKATDKSMKNMFYSCPSLVQIEGLKNIDITNVTDMSGLFWSCGKLATIDVSCFDTTNITDMSRMFSGCQSLTELDVSTINTKNVTNMNGMLGWCYELTSIKGLENFKTSNVTDMRWMFYDDKKLATIDLSSFDTSKVTNMSQMFGNCEKLTTIEGLKNFNTSNVTDMSSMFSGCQSLTELDVGSFDTSKVTDMSEMFCWCNNLTTIKGLNGEKWDTTNVTNMNRMFVACSSLTTLDLSKFDLSAIPASVNTTNPNLEDFLGGALSLTEIKAPKNMNGMTIQVPKYFGMTEIDPSMEGMTLLKGSKEFNMLYNTLMKINVCTEYAQAQELQTLYDGLNSTEKNKLATLTDDSGVILTDKLSYMVGYADYKANEVMTASGTHLVLSARTGQYLVIVIACLSLSLIGGYYFIQKKKYAK